VVGFLTRLRPPTPFSPERRYVVRPSMVDPESQLAVGNGIMDRDNIQGAVATDALFCVNCEM